MIIRTRLVVLVVAAGATLTGAPGVVASSQLASADQPMITSVLPATGDPSGQVFVMVRGNHFDSARSVTVAGQNREFRTVAGEPSQLLVRVPPLRVGTYQVVVTTPDGASPHTTRSEYHVMRSPWTAVSPQLLRRHEGVLEAADCSQTACYAVGREPTTGTTDGYHPVVFAKPQGGQWHQVKLAVPKGKNYRNSLGVIGCGNQGTCAAVADRMSHSMTPKKRASFAVGSKNHWTFMSAPLPADTEAVTHWDDATCRWTKCVALGSYEAASGTKRRLVVETYAHGTWTPRKVPGAATVDPKLVHSFGELGGVACPTTTCVGVARLANDQPVAVTVDLASSRPVQVVPLPIELAGDDNAVQMTGIACPSARRCTAIGDAYNLQWDDADQEYDESGMHSFAEVFDHGQWTEQDIPLPAPSSTDPPDGTERVHAIDCATTGTCYAVGELTSNGNNLAATVTRFNRHRVDTVYPEQPDRYTGHSTLQDVDCASGSSCTAFGLDKEDTDGDPLYVRFSVHLGRHQRPLYWSVQSFLERVTTDAWACRTPSRCIVTIGDNVLEK
jgi:hypothetical protein